MVLLLGFGNDSLGVPVALVVKTGLDGLTGRTFYSLESQWFSPQHFLVWVSLPLSFSH